MMFATLDEIVHVQAAARGDRGYTLFEEGRVSCLPYAALNQRASTIGSELAARMAPKSRAILIYPPSLDFIEAFFAALRAGVIPVPLMPPLSPNLDSWIASVERVIDDVRPDILLSNTALLALRDSAGVAVGPASLPWLATDTFVDGGEQWAGVRPRPDDVALLQYTSGSTTNPKGVVLTHANLLANQRVIAASFDISSDREVAVSWLPLFHDMGLIGIVMQSIYHGANCYLLSPLDFLRRPIRWLEVISEYGGTCTGGPNFAYELCIRRTRPEERELLDLSSWRVAFNGAEPVRADTLRRFADAFAPAGFRESAFLPCYGLAEASLYVTGIPATATFGVKMATSDGLVGETVADAKEVVSVGIPADNHAVMVVDPKTEECLEDGRVGEIWVSGPSVSQGYWRRPEETARVFGAYRDGRTWLRTGDLGFLADGELFVSGRMNEVMTIRGRNVFPADVEEAAQQADGRLRRGCGAAFAVDTSDGQGIVIVQETAEETSSALEGLVGAIRRGLSERTGITPFAVLLVPPRTVPKTSSGKLQRLRCREAFLKGTVPAVFSWTDREFVMRSEERVER